MNIKSIISISFFLLCAVVRGRAQTRDDGQDMLCSLIIKECGFNSPQDSVRISAVVRQFCKEYKIKRIRLVTNGTASSHFFLFGRVMMLNKADSGKICRVFLNEVPHAAQFAEKPLYYSILFTKGFIATFIGAPGLARWEREKIRMLHEKYGCKRWIARLWVMYERQERIRGTAEYDAHAIRQPQIEAFFYSAVNR